MSVAAVTSNVEIGEYIGELEVRLSCVTPNVTIYYTLDGTSPSITSLIYDDNNPIKLNYTTTIKTYAISKGLDGYSGQTSFKYTIYKPLKKWAFCFWYETVNRYNLISDECIFDTGIGLKLMKVVIDINRYKLKLITGSDVWLSQELTVKGKERILINVSDTSWEFKINAVTVVSTNVSLDVLQNVYADHIYMGSTSTYEEVFNGWFDNIVMYDENITNDQLSAYDTNGNDLPEICPSPTISPTGNTFQSPLTVNVTAYPGSETYYDINSNGSINSYGPINGDFSIILTGSGSISLTAYSTFPTMIDSDSILETYSFAPTLAKPFAVPPSGIYDSNIDVYLQKDNSNPTGTFIEYSLDGVNFETYLNPITIYGPTIITFYAKYEWSPGSFVVSETVVATYDIVSEMKLNLKRDSYDKCIYGERISETINAQHYNLYKPEYKVLENIDDLSVRRNIDSQQTPHMLRAFSGKWLSMNVDTLFNKEKDIIVINGIPHPIIDSYVYFENSTAYIWNDYIQENNIDNVFIFVPKSKYVTTKKVTDFNEVFSDDERYLHLVIGTDGKPKEFGATLPSLDHTKSYFIINIDLPHYALELNENILLTDPELENMYANMGLSIGDDDKLNCALQNEMIRFNKWIVKNPTYNLVYIPYYEDKYKLNKDKILYTLFKDSIITYINNTTSTINVPGNSDSEHIDIVNMCYKRDDTTFDTKIGSFYNEDITRFAELIDADMPKAISVDKNKIKWVYNMKDMNILKDQNIVDFSIPYLQIIIPNDFKGPYEIYFNNKFFHSKPIRINYTDSNFFYIPLTDIFGSDIIKGLHEVFVGLPTVYNNHVKDVNSYLILVKDEIMDYLNFTFVARDNNYKRYDAGFLPDFNNVIFLPDLKYMGSGYRNQLCIYVDGYLLDENDWQLEYFGGIQAMVINRRFNKKMTKFTMTYVDYRSGISKDTFNYSNSIIDEGIKTLLEGTTDRLYLNGLFIRPEDLFMVDVASFVSKITSHEYMVGDNTFVRYIDSVNRGIIKDYVGNDKRKKIINDFSLTDDINLKYLQKEILDGRPIKFEPTNLYHYIYFIKYVIYQEYEGIKINSSDPGRDFTQEELEALNTKYPGLFANSNYDIIFGNTPADVYPSDITIGSTPPIKYLPRIDILQDMINFFGAIGDKRYWNISPQLIWNNTSMNVEPGDNIVFDANLNTDLLTK